MAALPLYPYSKVGNSLQAEQRQSPYYYKFTTEQESEDWRSLTTIIVLTLESKVQRVSCSFLFPRGTNIFLFQSSVIIAWFWVEVWRFITVSFLSHQFCSAQPTNQYSLLSTAAIHIITIDHYWKIMPDSKISFHLLARLVLQTLNLPTSYCT